MTDEANQLPTQISTGIGDELGAMQAIDKIFNRLDDAATINRVLNWAVNRYTASSDQNRVAGIHDPKVDDSPPPVSEFTDLASFFEIASPSMEIEKALVTGYWFQQIEGNNDFGSQTVNTGLKDLGHAASNITHAFTQLIKNKLVLQVKKAGKSQQARKRYKLTRRGIQKVEEMLKAGGVNDTQNVRMTEKTKKSAGKAGKRLKARKAYKPKLNKSLNLRGEGDQISLEDFMKGYDTSSHQKRNLLLVYYLKNEMGIEKVGVDEVYTCYKHLGLTLPSDIKQKLYETSTKGWLDTAYIHDITVTEIGRGVVLDKLPKTPGLEEE